ELLRSAGVTMLIDVRIAPGSRRNPHVARAELERWLPRHGVSYRWEKRLGGFRRPAPDSPDVAWRGAAFPGVARPIPPPGLPASLPAADERFVQAAPWQLAVMCSESPGWRCHRRLIADFAEIARGVPVRHLMHDGRLAPHRQSPGVRLAADGLLVYDGGQQQL